MQESRVQSLGREDSCGRRRGNPLQEFFPGKFHGQSNLAGHSPHGRKESGTAEHTHTIYHTVSENSNLSSVETEYHQDQLNLLQGIENFIYLVDVLVKSSPFYYVSNISICSSGQKCLVFFGFGLVFLIVFLSCQFNWTRLYSQVQDSPQSRVLGRRHTVTRIKTDLYVS